MYYKIAKNIKSKTFLDTRGNLILDNVYNNILVKPNIKELEEMFSDKIDTEEKIIKYAKKIIEKGVKNVIVSMGSKGAMLINENICLKASIPKGEYINSIGSGDSMVAGFIYSYINNFDDINKLKYAIACGSATAYSYGIANIDLVNKLLEDIEIMEVIIWN